MIVNTYSVTAFAMDALSAILSAVTLAMAGSLAWRRYRSGDSPGEFLALMENRTYLIFWMGAVLLGIRLLAWPLFYATLHSFVPEIQGAMCTFGVTRVLPGLTRFLEFLKPLIFFLAGLWLVLFWMERFGAVGSKAGGRGAEGRVLALLITVSSLILVDAFAGAVLWSRVSPKVAVTCCSAITDIPTRFTAWMPEAMLGPQYQKALWPVYYGGNLLVVGLAGLVFWSVKKESPLKKIYLTGLAMATIVNGATTGLAFIETVGPRLMRTPFHHCLYCLLQKVPDAPLFIGLFVLGSFAALWTSFLYMLVHKGAKPQTLHSGQRKLSILSLICLAVSLEMVTIHLLGP